MKTRFTFTFFSAVFLLLNYTASYSQDATADPGSYMNSISNAETGMNKAYMAYISAAAHSSRKKKIEKMRNIAVDDIINCQAAINNLPPYKGDNTLRGQQP